MAAKFELKAAKGGKFVFNLKATNGQVILSSEIYESKKAAEVRCFHRLLCFFSLPTASKTGYA